MEFEAEKAIYLQIADWIETKILTGVWQERIPAIRELAAEVKVNPNTIARAYAYLEAQGAITSQRGLGYFVAHEARDRILKARKQIFLEKTVPQFLQSMRLLKVSFEELKAIAATFD